jgi:putative transposase
MGQPPRRPTVERSMARQPRLIIPGIAVHIVQRRVDRTACFREDSDRFVYLSVLRDLIGETQCDLHAYCLMTNHVHLLLTPHSEKDCAVLMRDLGRKYVRYFNDRHRRSGTLWEGRYHSCLVDSPDYVLNCYRYIERNPVRAGMAGEASAYAWSSHKVNVGAIEDPLIASHSVYIALATDAQSRSAAYEAFSSGEEHAAFLLAIREATYTGYPLTRGAHLLG